MQCPIQYDGPAGAAGTQDYICYVYDPTVFGDYLAHPFCYNPLEQTCTGTNFLCAVDAPLACGTGCFSADKLSCVVDPTNFLNSYLVPKVPGAETGSKTTFSGQINGEVCLGQAITTTNSNSTFESPYGTCTAPQCTILGNTQAPSGSNGNTGSGSTGSTGTTNTGASGNKASSATQVQAVATAVMTVAAALCM